MISIRSGAFETNSSSTHAIIINRSDVISEFIQGKHFLNRTTGEIVLEDDLEKEKAITVDVVNLYINAGFRAYADDIYKELFNKDITYRYGIMRVVDRIWDRYYNENEQLDWDKERHLIRNDLDRRRVFINHYLDINFIRFKEMDENCDIAMSRNTVMRDRNNVTFDAITVYGEDSYSFGEWPTQ